MNVQCAIRSFNGDDVERVNKLISDYDRVMDTLEINPNTRLLYAKRKN